MSHFEEQLRLVGFFKACIECSIYIAPTDPGLTHQELFEVGSRVGHQQGEMSDALLQLGTPHRGFQNGRIMPSPNDAHYVATFLDARGAGLAEP
jgi:hypothetical protein